MSYRAKLVLAFSLTVAVAVGVVAWAVGDSTRRAFEQLDSQRTAALAEQFRREVARRGEDVALRVEAIADAEATLRMAIDLSRPEPDYSLYMNDARGLSVANQLDFLEFVAADGTVVSSAQWPARFGSKNDWVTQPVEWKVQGAFLKREELIDRVELALVAVRVVAVGEKKLCIIGGRRLDKDFLSALVLPAGMRALLYRNLEESFSPALLASAAGEVEQAERLAPLIEEARQPAAGKAPPAEVVRTIAWSADPASQETFHAIPLRGRDLELLGVLLVGSSRRDPVELERFIRNVAILFGGAGIVLGILFGSWAASRVTRPVVRLAEAARQVAAGDLGVRVNLRRGDEIGALARAFDRMTQQLAEQRERLLQAERVAAWRELARRLAHELKNPLFPLQITVENLQRVRAAKPAEFDEVFRESTRTLLAELEQMKTIVGRFSDFAKMPPPQLRATDLNELVRGAVRLFEAQFSAAGRPPIAPELYLEEGLPPVPADPDLVRRALQNLILNAMDAMPAGGALTMRTARMEGGVRLEVADTGTGLTREECERLFTPYYTTKQHGTGLGLAIVQAVVSDHGGRIAVESEPGRGTTFRIELRQKPAEARAAPSGPEPAAEGRERT